MQWRSSTQSWLRSRGTHAHHRSSGHSPMPHAACRIHRSRWRRHCPFSSEAARHPTAARGSYGTPSGFGAAQHEPHNARPGFPSSADCFVPDSPKGASPLTSRRQKRAHAYRGVVPGCSQQPGTKSHPTVLSSRRSNETTGFMAQKVSCAEMRTLPCIR